MQTVTVTGHSDYRDKGSRFYGFLAASESVEQAEKVLEKLKNEHPTATHHCYAWRIGLDDIGEYSQDDGEPSGSAGLPILNELRSHDLINCILISVRYYGGTKLGKKGLIHAYGTSARMSIDNAVLGRVVQMQRFRIEYPYSLQPAIDKLRHDFAVQELDASYLEHVELILGVPIQQLGTFRKALASIEHQLIGYDELDRTYITS
ncbi:MAG: YigZ family protein [Balneolaceae bacterium]|nr:YigZ family protein [Balneolaceae bacterium]